ncbi:arrestin domain-containing protein 3-like isoform X2 [Echeneis naucrates]|nr:arrestin domain-containing protein 3-like isoform X2 [Echeneis naucrates]
MPSSFTGAHGKIVYKLTASLSRSWKMDSTVEKNIPFVSKSFPDLLSLMTHQVASKSKEIGLFSKGRVQMDVTVDKTGYAPGETVQILAKINNSSSSEMTPKFSLIQNVVFHASNNTKHQSSVITKAVENRIRPRTERSIKCRMMIPHDQIQTINNCDIISVKYNLKVYLDISFAFDLEINFPVVILPLGLAPQLQGATAAGPYPAWATAGPSTSNFSPPAMSMGPSSPHSRHTSRGYQSMYVAQRPAYPAQPVRMSRDYNHPVPQPAGSPFSMPSNFVLRPPPPAPAFHPTPSAPEIYPPPSSALNMYPTAPAYNTLPSAPMMNTDFLSQSDEPPPAYSLLFPSSDTDTSDGK